MRPDRFVSNCGFGLFDSVVDFLVLAARLQVRLLIGDVSQVIETSTVGVSSEDRLRPDGSFAFKENRLYIVATL